MSDRVFAFLRAINTGGRRLDNDALLTPIRSLGFDEVAAYQAAGNVTFRTGVRTTAARATWERRRPELEEAIDGATCAAYGFESPVFVRSAAEIDAVVDEVPFARSQIERTEGRVQVTFLRREIDRETEASVRALVPSDDAVEFVGTVWYWLPRAGVSDSTLPVGRIEALVGPMTMRTLGTVVRMRRKFAD